MANKLKVLLLNLPLPDFFNKIQKGNTQIFSDYIESINRLNNNRIDIIKLSRNILENLNNRALIEKIIEINPDIVGFSSYLWNIERNIYISKKLKESGIITLTGGPEISKENNYIFKENNFDYYFEGESEFNLYDFLINFNKNKTFENYMKNESPVNFNDFISTYTEVTDDYKYDKLFYLEIERGCPFKCVYCAYNKFNSNILTIDFEIFKKVFAKVIDLDVNEIYLLAPTLNRDKNKFNEYLDFIISIKNQTSRDVNLFGEFRAELLDDDDIKKMSNAGFKEIEFGIQSLNIKSFNRLERGNQNFKFIEFSKKLLSNGINPMIDFIVGLPHDNYANIINTIELLDRNNLLKYSNFYHLHVLANTELRNIFNSSKYIYDKKSPYFSYQTDSLTFQDIRKIYYYLEEQKDLTDYTDFFDYNDENFYKLENENDLEKLDKTIFYNSSSLLYIDNFNESKIINFFNNFFSKNSEIFHKLLIYSRHIINQEFLNDLNEVFCKHKNYYDLYKDGINFSNDMCFSKIFHVLVKPDFNSEYIKSLRNNFLVDFIYFSDEIELYERHKELLKDAFDKEGSYLYLFKENENIKEEYVRIFPINYI